MARLTAKERKVEAAKRAAMVEGTPFDGAPVLPPQVEEAAVADHVVEVRVWVTVRESVARRLCTALQDPMVQTRIQEQILETVEALDGLEETEIGVAVNEVAYEAE